MVQAFNPQVQNLLPYASQTVARTGEAEHSGRSAAFDLEKLGMDLAKAKAMAPIELQISQARAQLYETEVRRSEVFNTAERLEAQAELQMIQQKQKTMKVQNDIKRQNVTAEFQKVYGGKIADAMISGDTKVLTELTLDAKTRFGPDDWQYAAPLLQATIAGLKENEQATIKANLNKANAERMEEDRVRREESRDLLIDYEDVKNRKADEAETAWITDMSIDDPDGPTEFDEDVLVDRFKQGMARTIDNVEKSLARKNEGNTPHARMITELKYMLGTFEGKAKAGKDLRLRTQKGGKEVPGQGFMPELPWTGYGIRGKTRKARKEAEKVFRDLTFLAEGFKDKDPEVRQAAVQSFKKITDFLKNKTQNELNTERALKEQEAIRRRVSDLDTRRFSGNRPSNLPKQTPESQNVYSSEADAKANGRRAGETVWITDANGVPGRYQITSGE